MDLLETSRSILEKVLKLPAVQQASTPTLWHPDFHMRNIYVSEDDPTVSTGVIDWQSTSIEAALKYRLETPDFAQLPPYDGDLGSRREGEISEEKRKSKADTSLCNRAFGVSLNLIPNLNKAKALDENLVRLFLYCYTSWRMSAECCYSSCRIVRYLKGVEHPRPLGCMPLIKRAKISWPYTRSGTKISRRFSD